MRKTWLAIIGVVSMMLVIFTANVIARADTTPLTPGKVMALAPSRIMDTRTGLGADGPVGDWNTRSLQVTGKGGVPTTGVAAVFVNITVVSQGGVWLCNGMAIGHS